MWKEEEGSKAREFDDLTKKNVRINSDDSRLNANSRNSKMQRETKRSPKTWRIKTKQARRSSKRYPS